MIFLPKLAPKIEWKDNPYKAKSKLKVDPDLDQKAEAQIASNKELLKSWRDNLGKTVAR